MHADRVISPAEASPKPDVTQSQATAVAKARAGGNAVSAFVALAVIIAATFIYNGWMLDPRTFFYADDWYWIWDAEFQPWNVYYSIYSILPSAAISDRPVGVAFLRAFYHLVGVDHWAFQIAFLSLHAVNCMVLYLIAVRYAGRSGAVLAALLAAVWFSANPAVSWSSGIFDLLGATMCLLTLLLRQLALKSTSVKGILYDLAGAATYLIAIRTKEFALGIIALLFVVNVLVERQTVRATIKQLVPYLAVFAICAVRYANLLTTSGPEVGNPYHLDFSVLSIVGNLGYYVRELFYAEAGGVHPLAVAGLIAGLGAGIFTADEKAQRTAVFGIAAFVIMLGPALLLPKHQDPLYLYTPHFFFALVMGALFAKRIMPSIVAAAASVAIVVAPTATHFRDYAIDWYVVKGAANQSMLKSAVGLLTPLDPRATVFISGVEPYFNPFSASSGNSLRVAFKNADLAVDVERPEADLMAKFCETPGAKRFLRFKGSQATEVTGEVEKTCNRQKQG